MQPSSHVMRLFAQSASPRELATAMQLIPLAMEIVHVTARQLLQLMMLNAHDRFLKEPAASQHLVHRVLLERRR